ncbi:MAG TPA: hypothetical protein DCZ91_24490 [Lachnospiraceae bacterium]|nr:hypothetical protein [Lachnospiraceae bacterium]
MINIEDVPGLETELQMVNTHIERLCRSNNESMQKMLDWVLNARGKQIRPILTLLCARLKGKIVDATEIAAVIEICHTASLIHDDIIDEADTRRGQLSVQKKFGKEMAVYAGDFMIFSTIRRTGLKNRAWYGMMFDKLETMCDGEVSQFDNRYNTEITEEKYIENILGKTSAMFCIACGSGACEGRCEDNEVLAVEQYAEKFGLLFQLTDDLLDFADTDDLAKKTTHNDFWRGYYTLPVIHSFSDSRNGAELKQIATDIKNGLYSELTDRRIAELISASDGFGYTLMMIDKYVGEAKQSLSIFKDSVARKKLQEFVDTVQQRAHRIVADFEAR